MPYDRFGISGDEIEEFSVFGGPEPDPNAPIIRGPIEFVFSDRDTLDDMTPDQWLAMDDEAALRLITEDTTAVGEDARRMLKLLRTGKPIMSDEFPFIADL